MHISVYCKIQISALTVAADYFDRLPAAGPFINLLIPAVVYGSYNTTRNIIEKQA